MNKIIIFLDEYLEKSNRESIGAIEANELLNKYGILKDNKSRAGKPLRDLLRKGTLPHAFQTGGIGTSWIIPHSNMVKNRVSKNTSIKKQNKNIGNIVPKEAKNNSLYISELKNNLKRQDRFISQIE